MTAPSLQVHYYLKDDVHEMNAFVRNKCEAELLAALQYFCEQIGFEATIESSAYEEGGLKERLQFAFKPEHAYTNIMAAVTLVLSSFIQIWNAPPKPNKELEAINVDIARETLEEKRLANEKARRELQKTAAEQPKPPELPASAAKRATAGGFRDDLKTEYTLAVPRERTINREALAFLAAEPRFSVRRSNFYKTLLPYDKVTSVGMGVAVQQPARVHERVVQKRDFVKFVLTTDRLEPTVIEEAVIHITAPVIDGSNVKWKGTLDGEPVSFSMKDEAFKGMVMRREVSFQNGNAIRCRLIVDSKLSEVGEIEVTSRTVEVVIEKLDELGKATETPQGRQQRFVDKHAKDQQPLFNFNERTDS